jgi:hypothetical protein
MGRLSHTLLDWENLAFASWLRSSSTAYPTLAARLEAFLATVSNGGAARLWVGNEYMYIQRWAASCPWQLGRWGFRRAAPGCTMRCWAC